jgi:photosystem II stability/assembly factor-like uncharacterized protein
MMIKHTVLIALFINALLLNAQPNGPWVLTKNDKSKTFYDIREEFDTWWEGRSQQKGDGFKQFKRWENFWEHRILKDGSFPSMALIKRGFEEAKSQEQTGESDWVSLGPFNYEITSSWSAGHGRINTIVVDPNDPNTIYIGAPVGGIWKSTNNGESWTVLNDFEGVIGVSQIAIDPDNSDIIYIATGDADANDTYSIGVLKTIDGGENWDTTGLSTNLLQLNTVFTLNLDPENNQILYVGTSFGLYKSTDAGTTFSLILEESIEDFSFHPQNSQIIYAASSAFLYRSADGGENFIPVENGLPQDEVSRIKISVTPDEPDYVYLIMVDYILDFKGLYRSFDSGLSFELVNDTSGIFDGSKIAWYALGLTVDPLNSDIIYTGTLNIWKSIDGGGSFIKVNNWDEPESATYTHADIHFLGFYNDILYCGSDGGIYVSENDANSFQDISVGLQIGQFYRIDGTEESPNTIVGGLQDNGGYYTASGIDDWKVYFGADGMDCAIDYTNKDVIYGAVQLGRIYKSEDAANSIVEIGKPENGAWITPFQIDPADHNRLIAGYKQLYEYKDGNWNVLSDYSFGGYGAILAIEVAPSNSEIIYLAQHDSLFKSIDGGETIIKLTNPSSKFITDIAVDESDPDLIWITVGGWTESNKVFTSIDGGANWINISAGLPNLPTNCITIDNGFTKGLYIGNDYGVYYLDDQLDEWILYNNQLPNTIINDLYINKAAGLITAGTYGRGVWQSPLYSTTVSIKEIVLEGVKVYPNPANNELNIEFEKPNSNTVVELISDDGKIIRNKKVSNERSIRFDISGLTAGTYFIRIEGLEKTLMNKVIIVH